MSSSSSHRSVDVIDYPPSTNESKNTNFAPLHRTSEVENLNSNLNQEKQCLSSTTTTKKMLTKCFTVIGDGTDK